MYRFKGVPVPASLVPAAVYLEMLELRLRKATNSDRGEGAVSAAIVVVAIVGIAGAIVIALNALKDRTAAKVDGTNP
ncbi:MAG: hypothetical protein HOW97_25465 [Catenulispora sp.]|nr:hypothetical protein [Catenulispora sp.]